MDSVNGSSGTAGTSGTHDSQSASLGAQSTPTQADRKSVV